MPLKGIDVTVEDVEKAIELEKHSDDGIFASAIQRKGLGVCIHAEIELEDRTHKRVKFLRITPEGLVY